MGKKLCKTVQKRVYGCPQIGVPIFSCGGDET